jgi:hypothetical protein
MRVKCCQGVRIAADAKTLRERAAMLRYTCAACLVSFNRARVLVFFVALCLQMLVRILNDLRTGNTPTLYLKNKRLPSVGYRHRIYP